MIQTFTKGLKRLVYPHATAETWLNNVLGAIAREGEHETICLQPDDAGAIHALVAGPFRPDSDLDDGTGGFRLDIETPGLFVLGPDMVPFDAPRLSEPLSMEYVDSLFTVLDRWSEPSKASWRNDDTGLTGKSLLLKRLEPLWGIRISAYVHNLNGKRLVKFDVRHDSLDVKKWLDEVIL